jgi:hypothetical protein
MTSTASSAPPPGAPPLAPAAPASRRIAVVLTSLVAGAAGCLIAYWTWRVVLRLPIAFGADLRLAAHDASVGDTSATPWWVPTAIVGAIAMMLWPILAAHARRISLIGGSAAIVLVSVLIFPIAAVCVEVTAITHDGWPPIIEFMAALPHVLGDAVRVTFVNLLYCGLVTVPAAALIGLTLAALGRTMVWLVERFSRLRNKADGANALR